jgi:hypothetical protein
MKKQGGGFGFVILIVVVVVVLLLATRAWRAVMPAATQAVLPGVEAPVDDHGQVEAGAAIRSGSLPDLKQMGQSTNQHIEELEEAARNQD